MPKASKAPKAPRELIYVKCQRCRFDKAKCLPESRQWPGPRCSRCERFNYTCSESRTKAQESALHHPSEESKSSDTATPFSERTDGDLITALGDLTWLRKYSFEHIFWDRDLNDEDLREEIRLRASGYVAKGNLQDALYMYEVLHRTETILYGQLQFKVDSDIVDLQSRPSNPSGLADLHLRRENFFQAELVLEEFLIFQDQFIEEFSPDEDDIERPVSSLIDLYKKFKARILAYDPRYSADKITMHRVARIDNTQLWKDLLLAGLIPPLNPTVLDHAKIFKVPNLVQLVLDQEDYVQERSDSDEISLRTAPEGESATASDVVADPLGSGLPLHKAVIRDSWWKFLRLLDEGNVHIDSRDKYKNTPLILAVCLGRWSMVRALIRRGANTNASDTDGNTIIDLADQKMSMTLLYELIQTVSRGVGQEGETHESISADTK